MERKLLIGNPVGDIDETSLISRRSRCRSAVVLLWSSGLRSRSGGEAATVLLVCLRGRCRSRCALVLLRSRCRSAVSVVLLSRSTVAVVHLRSRSTLVLLRCRCLSSIIAGIGIVAVVLTLRLFLQEFDGFRNHTGGVDLAAFLVSVRPSREPSGNKNLATLMGIFCNSISRSSEAAYVDEIRLLLTLILTSPVYGDPVVADCCLPVRTVNSTNIVVFDPSSRKNYSVHMNLLEKYKISK